MNKRILLFITFCLCLAMVFSLGWSGSRKALITNYSIAPTRISVTETQWMTLNILPGLSQPLQIITGTKLVLGGYFVLEENEIIEGDLVILGGAVVLKPGSLVDGNVIQLGGNLTAEGTITGSMFSLGGVDQLSASTVVRGDVNVWGGSLEGENLAMIEGQVAEAGGDIPATLPGGLRFPFPNIGVDSNPVWDFMWLLFRSLLWAAAAVLIALFFSVPTRRVGETAISQALVAGGLGILSSVVAPLLILFLLITIIGIPVALLAVVGLFLAWAYGLIAIGIQIGERLSRLARGDWALPLSAALGTFLLTFFVNSVDKIIPCIGWLAPFLAGAIGLGAVLLTRFGSRPYPTEVVAVEFTQPGEPANG